MPTGASTGARCGEQRRAGGRGGRGSGRACAARGARSRPSAAARRARPARAPRRARPPRRAGSRSARAGAAARRASPAAAPGRASCWPCRRRPRSRARAPAGRPPAGGRSGTRRRSRPRRSAPPVAVAQATAAARRSGCSTTPVGNWCAGESTAPPRTSRRAGRCAPRARRPRSGESARPALGATARCCGTHGSSIASARAPVCAQRARHEREAVPEARADDHELGIGAHAAGAREVRGELLAQVARGRADRRSRATRPAAPRRPWRSALIQAACGKDVRSGRPGLKLKRAGRASRSGGVHAAPRPAARRRRPTCPHRAAPRGSPPPSSCAKASTTVPRESPRSPASARVEGSRVPAASRPLADRGAQRILERGVARARPPRARGADRVPKWSSLASYKWLFRLDHFESTVPA